MSGNTPFHTESHKIVVQKQIDEKKLRQQAFLSSILEQIESGKYDGVIPTLKRLNVPLGTYCRWLADKDFQDAREQIAQTKRARLNDEFWCAIINKGQGLSYLAYIVSGLKSTDPEWREKVEHSGNVGTIQMVSSVKRPDEDPPKTETTQKAQ